MTSFISKAVTQNIHDSDVYSLQTNTSHHSPGVILSSEKIVDRSLIIKRRTLINKTLPKCISLSCLSRGFIVELLVKNIYTVSSNTLYTVGLAITKDGQDFTQLCEARTLSEINEVCMGKHIPSNCYLVCKITTENDEENTDVGSIIITLTLRAK